MSAYGGRSGNSQISFGRHVAINTSHASLLSEREIDEAPASRSDSSFKYLGIVLETDHGCKGAVDVMKCAATRAMWSVVRQAQERDIQQIGLNVALFKALVLPVMSYGCEI